MAFIPAETYQHHGPLSTGNPHHAMRPFHSRTGPSSVFTNDIFREYPLALITGPQQTNNSYNSYNNTRPVVRNIKIQLEEEESENEDEINLQIGDKVYNEHANKEPIIETQSSESNKISSNETLLSVSQPILGQGRKSVLHDKENERNIHVGDSIKDKHAHKEQNIETQSCESNKISSNENLLPVSQPTFGQERKSVLRDKENERNIQVGDSINDKSANKEHNIETQSSESNKISSNENLLPVSQPTLGQGRKAVLLDLWNMNEISLQIRNWLDNSDFDLTPIIGNYQKGVSCGYIAAQAACIFRKLFMKEIEEEPLRPLIFSKCLDPQLIKKVNDVLQIDNMESVSLDMLQIYEAIISLMGDSDDLSWLTVTTWDSFLEGMREGHQSTEFSVWIINTADTESSLQEDYDDRGDHWFTVVIWP